MPPSLPTRTDHRLSKDEQRARDKLASSSSARKEAEAAKLRKGNSEVTRRLKSTETRTDDDIMDEEAGRKRIELAAASAAKRDSDAAAQKQFNEEQRQKREAALSRTDNDIMDEAAGRKRLELAAASAKRRDEDESALEKRNEEWRMRLKNIKSKTDDGDGGGLFEIIPLDPLVRGSDVWRASYLKFEVEQENRTVADRRRDIISSLRSQREQQEADRLARAHEAVSDDMRQRRRLRKLLVKQQRSNVQHVRSARAEMERWQATREENDRRYHEIARARVVEANGLDAKLDALEDAQDARERAEGTAMRLSLQQALETTRTAVYSEKRQMVESGMAARSGALSARAACFSPRRGRDVREQAKELKQKHQENEDEYLSWARANRRMAEDTRSKARKVLQQLLRQKQKTGKKVRDNDILVAEEKRRILSSNRREVAAVYSARFASKHEVSRMWNEPPPDDERADATPRGTPRGSTTAAVHV